MKKNKKVNLNIENAEAFIPYLSQLALLKDMQIFLLKKENLIVKSLRLLGYRGKL